MHGGSGPQQPTRARKDADTRLMSRHGKEDVFLFELTSEDYFRFGCIAK